MEENEVKFWEDFKEKYGRAFKRKAMISSNGECYVNIKINDIVQYDNELDEGALCGDIAEYIYDLEDIKEEALLIYKKYDKLEKENIKLKAKNTLLRQLNEALRHEEDEV